MEGFQDRLFQPLTHPSARVYNILSCSIFWTHPRCHWTFRWIESLPRHSLTLEHVRHQTASGHTSTTKAFYPDLISERSGSGGQTLARQRIPSTQAERRWHKKGGVVRPQQQDSL